ncbi:MAG: hypothetical protein M1817_001689 [Caeruleum heppii]|nr:MAG: hypothetical protein M1817_001689 [Caeruleum heppii]
MSPRHKNRSPGTESGIPPARKADPQRASSSPRQTISKRSQSISPNPLWEPNPLWDNLSRQWLTRSTLEEFDRRTATRAPLKRPKRSGRKKDCSDQPQLQRLGRRGGPSLRDIRGYPDPRQKPRRFCNMEQVKKSRKRLTAYDPAFEQHLLDNHIFPVHYKLVKPSNLEEINTRLAQRRGSLSPELFPRTIFEDFNRKLPGCNRGADVMSDLVPIIAGNSTFHSGRRYRFSNLASLTDGTIADPEPDLYDGSLPTELDARVRKELEAHIAPSKTMTTPLAPNFFLSVIGMQGLAVLRTRQALHYAAIGARAMNTLRSYGGSNSIGDDGGDAHVIITTFYAGELSIYTMLPVKSTSLERDMDFHLVLLETAHLMDSFQSFVAGIKAFRNAREWAREQRDQAIARANEKAADHRVPNAGISAIATTPTAD